MVDKHEAPQGYYAKESPQDLCVLLTGPNVEQCAFLSPLGLCIKAKKAADRGCSLAYRKDGTSVIFLVDPAATTASTVPAAASHAFQSAQLEKYLQDVEAVLEDIIDGEHAPAGMVAIPATNGCQGCFYLKGKADCVRTSAVSCTALGRPDESNVIFVPR